MYLPAPTGSIASSVAVEHEGRHADRGKQATDIHLPEDVLLGEYRAGARRQPLIPAPPGEQSLVAHERGIEERQRLLGVGRCAPARTHLGEVLVPLLLRPLPGVVRSNRAASRRRIQDQARHALRMHRREHRTERTCVGEAEQRRALRAHRVEHRRDIVHEILKRRQIVARVAVGQARSSPIDDHDSRKRRQPAQELREEGVLPDDLQVAERRDVDQIDRAVADDRKGDRHVTVSRVANLRLHRAHRTHVAARALAGGGPLRRFGSHAFAAGGRMT